jgi:hypothetical protein
VLNFDREQSLLDKKLGYYDAKRMLFGLYGKKYYIDRTFDEFEAYDTLRRLIIGYYADAGKTVSLRRVNEKILPRMEKGLNAAGDILRPFD